MMASESSSLASDYSRPYTESRAPDGRPALPGHAVELTVPGSSSGRTSAPAPGGYSSSQADVPHASSRGPHAPPRYPVSAGASAYYPREHVPHGGGPHDRPGLHGPQGPLAWPGQSMPLCGGRLLLGPERVMSLLSVGLICGPAGLFLGLPAWDLLQWPAAAGGSPAFFAAGAALSAFTLATFLAAALTDPGVIPRPAVPEEMSPEGARRSVEIGRGRFSVSKYCATCGLYRPPRASHCRVCDTCVERFDHHCPWLGTCVGRRNYRAFLLFLLGATLLCAYILGVCIYHLKLVGDGIKAADPGRADVATAATMAAPASLLLIVLAALIMPGVGGLGIMHITLINAGLTTYDSIREAGENPFDFGPPANWREVCCAPAPPSRVRQYVRAAHRAVAVVGVDDDRGLIRGTATPPGSGSDVEAPAARGRAPPPPQGWPAGPAVAPGGPAPAWHNGGPPHAPGAAATVAALAMRGGYPTASGYG